MRQISKLSTLSAFRVTLRFMSDTARDYKTFDSVATEGMEDLFRAGQGETRVTPCDVESVTEGVTQLLTLAEAARRYGIPYTTFYKQVKSGKHATVTGHDGKPRVIFQGNTEVTHGVFHSLQTESPVTHGVFLQPEGVTEAKHLEILQQLMGKLEAANYRIGWLESQVRERESDVNELKLLVDSQHKSSWWADFKKWFFGR